MTLTTQTNETSLPQYADDNSISMTPARKRFYASEQCLTARMALQLMVDSALYDTESSYFNGYAPLGFVDRHLHYLSTHPATRLEGYLSNLKLMTRIRADQ